MLTKGKKKMGMIEATNEKNQINSDPCFSFQQEMSQSNENIEIHFGEGSHRLMTTYAFEKFCFISNNDYGLKQIAFPIIGKKKVTIDGHGAKLIGIGRILPFYITESEEVVIKNFTIDYERPFFTQGEVVSVSEQGVCIKVDKEQYPYRIKDTVVHFYGEDYESDFVYGFLEFSKEEGRPEKDACDISIWGTLIGEEVEPGMLCIKNHLKHLPKVGTILSIKHEVRTVPAIFIEHSKEIRLENITIRHAATMGVIAQDTDTITIKNMTVAPDISSNRVVSANADALHFVGCRGKVLIEDSLFENQLDDILNVHGNYFKIHQRMCENTVVAEISHRQQVGVFSIRKGMKFYLCKDRTMKREQVLHVAEIFPINKKFCMITFQEAVGGEVEENYCLENMDAYPEVIFRNNKGGRNRARGLLLTTSKSTLIENNELDCEGAVIKISGDMNNWYESGGTSDIVIRNNRMKRHNYNVWGKALIDIDPEMEEIQKDFYFHKKIVIENNTITIKKGPLFYGQSVETLIFKGNHILTNEVNRDEDVEIAMRQVKNLKMEGNSYEGVQEF